MSCGGQEYFPSFDSNSDSNSDSVSVGDSDSVGDSYTNDQHYCSQCDADDCYENLSDESIDVDTHDNPILKFIFHEYTYGYVNCKKLMNYLEYYKKQKQLDMQILFELINYFPKDLVKLITSFIKY